MPTGSPKLWGTFDTADCDGDGVLDIVAIASGSAPMPMVTGFLMLAVFAPVTLTATGQSPSLIWSACSPLGGCAAAQKTLMATASSASRIWS